MTLIPNSFILISSTENKFSHVENVNNGDSNHILFVAYERSILRPEYKRTMNIVIGGDHAGFELKGKLITWLGEKGHDVMDVGTHSDESTDYPDYAHALANAVADTENALGILICGSANGVSMTANKHQDIRAAIAWLPEIASLAKQHNNANVVCLPARFISETSAFEIVEAFFGANFEGGRHERRVNKIACS
ncbi:MAG: ribose 5-phosphate isomerase B [Bacteroidota bacterium]